MVVLVHNLIITRDSHIHKNGRFCLHRYKMVLCGFSLNNHYFGALSRLVCILWPIPITFLAIHREISGVFLFREAG